MPYDAAAILEAMRESRRPGGVPDQLETQAIATEVASTIWTIDGQRWDTITIGGSCGPVRCTLEVGGTRFGSVGEDLWILEVIPAAGEVAVIDTTLRSVPPNVATLLDGLARTAEPGIEREGLVLASVRWRGPSAEDTYELSYRSGDEEGSCQLEILVETGLNEVTVEDSTGC